jgi:hypothetical protein
MELEFARAKLLPDAPRPEDLLGERQERVAAMAYQIHGIDEVRDYLVDHHRPRVANMARKHRVPQIFVPYNTAKQKNGKRGTLIEYGVMGLRDAAEPWRESGRYKDKIVGFATGKENRFAAYAEPYADKYMRSAIKGEPEPGAERQLKQEVIGTEKAMRPDGPWLRRLLPGASDMLRDYYTDRLTLEEIGKRCGRSRQWVMKQLKEELAQLLPIRPKELPPHRKHNKIYVCRPSPRHRLAAADHRARYSRRQDCRPEPVLLATTIRADMDREWHALIEEWLWVCYDGALSNGKTLGHLDRPCHQDRCPRSHDLWRPPSEHGITWAIYLKVSKEQAKQQQAALRKANTERKNSVKRSGRLSNKELDGQKVYYATYYDIAASS